MQSYLRHFFLLSAMVPSACMALVFASPTGTWPDTWPTELDKYRKRAISIHVATGTQETIYEIPISSTSELNDAWPHIVSLMTTGSLLVLSDNGSTRADFMSNFSKLNAGVRISAPTGGKVENPNGQKLRAGPPWPASVRLQNGDLPNYVAVVNGIWVPYMPRPGAETFHYRARIDVEVVIDGKVIDTSDIKYPTEAQLIDQR